MPWDEVMHKWASGELHSGSKSGPKVKSRSQALAIMESEKKKAVDGNNEYESTGVGKLAKGVKFKR